jgi:hypothetical protein
MRGWLAVWLGMVWLALQPGMAAPMVFTYRAAESAQDVRNQYDIALLQLSLEKTRASYGDFQLQPSPPMNTQRAQQELEKGTYTNFIIKQSYNPVAELRGVLRGRYEVDLGVVGYRVCFTRQGLLPALAAVTTSTQLNPYLFGLGNGWMDVEILRHNGLRVMEVGSYESLFPMAARGRFDLFCRGINEVVDEEPLARKQAGLVLEPTLMLYYDLPRFFYAHARDREALARVEAGIRLAAADGSLQALWQRYYLPSVQRVQPQQRRLLRLSNPDVADLQWDPQQLLFDPLSGSFQMRHRDP